MAHKLEEEPAVVSNVGELIKALDGVDPSTKLLIGVWTYKDKVFTSKAVPSRSFSVHTEDRRKGSKIELEMFSWLENGEMVSPVLKISNYDPLEMKID